MLERVGRAATMSAQCRYFEQHAWKREICTNCFKPREEHVGSAETSRPSVARASANLKTDVQKLQSILRGRTSCRAGRRKNVVFPDALTEVIGYGGNDFSDGEENNESDDPESFELAEPSGSEDDVPDSEDDRALGNLTRANTNFNTVTANLSDSGNAEAKAAKSFASLMLGKVQKDSEGKKKTLLVSVTPFGADDTLPTAKRPLDRKPGSGSTGPTKTKQEDIVSSSKQESEKTEAASKNLTKSTSSNKSPTVDTKSDGDGGLHKIVDMPLITSSNLISVIQKSDALTGCAEPADQRTCDEKSKLQTPEKRPASISRCPAIKKPESEKPKVALQTFTYSSKSDYTATKATKVAGPEVGPDRRLENAECTVFDSSLVPIGDPKKPDEKVEPPTSPKGKDVNKIEVPAAEEGSKIVASIDERTVEGEAGPEPILLSNRRFSFEESREHAGEPDGKADEEEITEPPALPRSLPPIDSRNCRNNRPPVAPETRSSTLVPEPITSFLHGETKVKPAVPQKPSSLPAKPVIAPKSPSSVATMKSHSGGYVLPPTIKNSSSQGQNPGKTINEAAARLSASYFTAPNPLSVNGSSDQGKTGSSSQEKVDSQIATGRSSDATGEPATSVFKANGTSEYSDRRAGGPSSISRDKPEPLNLGGSSPNDSEEGSQGFEDDVRGEISSDATAELIRSPNKRRMAPKPPATPTEELPASMFARNPAAANLKSDSPVVREKEKRERASSCSPKFRKAVCEAPDPCVHPAAPEPAPRRTISLSQGSLATPDKAEEKKKSRPRFSLKRLLRMGTRKDVDMTAAGGTGSRLDEIPTTPQPKPRLEIIHPLELDGAAVEVLRHERISRNGDDVTDSTTENPPLSPGSHQAAGQFSYQKLNEATNECSFVAARPSKPPPPPRNIQSQDEWARLSDPASKPSRPPPPRNEGKLPPRSEKPAFTKTWQPAGSPSASDSIYANLAAEDVTGEVRSALAPSKPQRTASMRDQTILQPPLKKRNVPCDIGIRDYEKPDSMRTPTSDSPTSNDSHVYECLSSSPECDSNLELRHGLGGGSRSNCKRKSDSSALDPCGGEFKYHQPTFTRSTSLPYCGSETESELYSPYSFYTGDEGPEDDQDWKAKEEEFGMNRVRQRRGRSIVHRSLEDNYGAVIVANHEALAQLLERLNQATPIPPNLRSLKTANPRLNDFDLDTESLIVSGKKVFSSGVWNEHPVTVCLALDSAMTVSRKEFCPTPIAEFVDVVPEKISLKCFAGRKDVDASVSVFARMQVNTVKSFAVEISRDQKTDGWTRESCFVLLQFVNALKNLQARGIEEAPKNLGNVVLCREDKDACYRLYLLQGLNVDTGDDRDEERGSLCQCALVALQELGLGGKLPVIRELLMRERAVTLSQVKSVLEFSLWGPSDASLGVVREREVVLQRWLDLERANVLHALVRTRAPLTVTDEYQLMFLVRTSARIMCEASVLLDEQQQRVDSIRSN